MIKELTSKTRRTIVRCRCLAMLDKIDSAFTGIEEAFDTAGGDAPLLDEVALLSLKGELLYLDCREPESLKVFEDAIKPKLDTLKQEVRFIVGQNQRNVALAAFQFSSERQADLLYDQ